MGHMLNHGLTTSAKGASWEQIRLKCSDGAGTFVIDEDCGAGLITSVTRNSQGNYTLQFSKPYPAKVVVISPEMACATNTQAAVVARYQNASYSATNGNFVLFTSTSAGTAAADPSQNDECHIVMVFRRYTANP